MKIALVQISRLKIQIFPYDRYNFILSLILFYGIQKMLQIIYG